MKEIPMNLFRNKMSVPNLKEWAPCRIMADGEFTGFCLIGESQVKDSPEVLQSGTTLEPDVAHMADTPSPSSEAGLKSESPKVPLVAHRERRALSKKEQAHK